MIDNHKYECETAALQLRINMAMDRMHLRELQRDEAVHRYERLRYVCIALVIAHLMTIGLLVWRMIYDA